MTIFVILYLSRRYSLEFQITVCYNFLTIVKGRSLTFFLYGIWALPCLLYTSLPYYGKNPIFHPYDRSGKSRASIPYSCGPYYVAGGLNGGTAAAYLALCRELKKRTDEDRCV